MHRAREHTATQTRERRHRLAHEAARLMVEGGIQDFHQAKRKAAIRLGIHDDASLPRNAEIEQALREHQRLFAGSAQSDALRQRREAAVHALEFLQAFAPRLAGPVLEGTADAHSPVQLHLHEDDPDAVQRFLDEHGIPAEARSRRLRWDRERVLDAPLWVFSADGVVFELLVLPCHALRQAPLSAVDEKPMRRASLARLRELLQDTAPAPGDTQG
ncbi:hypothetical protein CXF96_11430 [Stenotrophomonas sp. Betaine-02u-21]|jgi:hypothetical protein|uniref:hypothetical protein n=1 Tax=Stenotrophomonas TaxID=40323 RepID=UPI000C31BE94|nr:MULTISPECIES: hypothetical protein [Stenotrophomonas]PKH70477.1 hypothetical protein CXF90_14305 [Stenotrophomonas sp. Betaine-02u-23]PKH73642.1 hypothetical protein CXF96_11430 [Stenotrophomonas sp. Betaine-02u-21]PKH94819.1 hypothetical protein CXG43_16500 [Stenotrophomonas sp. Bg11-02]